MSIVIFNNSTNKIVHWHVDNSTSPASAQERFNNYLADNKISDASHYRFSDAKISLADFEGFEPGNHLWDSVNNKMIADPNYKAPVAPKLATTGIPSTDTSTNKTVNAPSA
jgi:hypothetical protein